MLAKAGEDKSVSLSFVGFGVAGRENKKGDIIEDYAFIIPSEDVLSVSNQPLSSLDGDVTFDRVDIIQVSIAEHCAAYAPGCGSRKTQGSTAIIGRTVPSSLKVIETESGDIEGDIVYAGKRGVNFRTVPYFTVVGLDVHGMPLDSYSGELAGGLKVQGVTTLKFGSDEININNLESVTEEIKDKNNIGTGKHKTILNADNLTFIKGAFPGNGAQPSSEVEHFQPRWNRGD
ncbi:hypothetical protein MBH78_21665 [Oceanimonas sp. NS1]|nr:hypothetical protein [Oceanimonas sp. NS1]